MTVGHRVLIVLGTSLLLLAVLRRLLTPAIAWALALWWVVLPVNYDVLYEIHLFGALVGLAIALVALRWSGLAARSAVFGLLLASALLVRNENIVAAASFAAVWLGYEIWRMRRGTGPSAARLSAAVAIPLVAFSALVGMAALRTQGEESIVAQFRAKHELNICGVYAYGRWESGDTLVANPLEQCFAYTARDFGERWPSLTDAVAENPGAMARHFARNATLVPAGLEVNLFNAKFGSTDHGSNPDFVPVNRGSWLVLAGSLAVLLVIGAGSVVLWRERRRWWREWLRDRVWGWVALAAMGSAALYAALLTLPRPAYLRPLSVLIFACVGFSLVVLADRLGIPRRARAAIPPLALAALILVPTNFREGYENPQIGPGQRLRQAVERVEPFREQIAGDRHGLLAAYPATAVCGYVGGYDDCSGVPWTYPVGETLTPALAGEQELYSSHPIDFIYADEPVFEQDPGIRGRLERLQARGWRRLAPASPDAGWILLGRETGGDAGREG